MKMLFTALKRTIRLTKDYLRLPKRLFRDFNFSTLPTTQFTKHQ